MIREDSRIQSSFAILTIGAVMALMIMILTLFLQTERGFSTTNYVLLFLGSALVLAGFFLFRKRMRDISHTYSTGQVIKAKVTDASISSTKSMTRTEIEVVYTFMGRERRSKTSIPYAVFLSPGATIAIIVDPDKPDEFVLRDSYQTERGAIEASTDTCSVCGEEVPFLEVNNHMKAVHPREYLAWKFWMAAVVLTVALPIAAIALSVPMFNDDRVVIVCVVSILVIVFSQLAIDRFGKRWETKVHEAWKAKHKGRRERD